MPRVDVIYGCFLPPHRMKLFPGIPTPITKTSPRSSTLFAALVLPLFLTLLGTSVAQPVQHGAEAADNDDVASSAYWKRAGFVGMRDGVQNAGMRAGKLVHRSPLVRTMLVRTSLL